MCSKWFESLTIDAVRTNALDIWQLLFYSKKMGQKTDFLAHFEKFFVYALLRSKIYPQIFCQIKRLSEINNCSKFH